MFRNVLIVTLLLTGLVACRTTKERMAVEAMQMPSRPEGTARLVLYRTDSVIDARAPIPVVAVNGETVGTLADETLIIRDVPPGELEITLSLREADQRSKYTVQTATLRADLNAGGEWFVEAQISEPCKAGTRPRNFSSVPTGLWQTDLMLTSMSAVSLAVAHATMECGAIYNLNPTWPKSTWNLNPLLKKYGAEPMQHTPLPDVHLPQSDLHWHVAERAIRSHFEGNNVEYIPFLDPSGRDNLLLKDITLVREERNADGTIGILVDVEYLHVSHETIAGRYVKRPLRYTLEPGEPAPKVARWADAD
ncbi:hypothetical protein [Ferrovibrio terrae]|uniref:hypothetical protein n=1 Tax=Ferrovibrio terrae TaxID=2594003 RepID=UPI00313799AF